MINKKLLQEIKWFSSKPTQALTPPHCLCVCVCVCVCVCAHWSKLACCLRIWRISCAATFAVVSRRHSRRGWQSVKMCFRVNFLCHVGGEWKSDFVAILRKQFKAHWARERERERTVPFQRQICPWLYGAQKNGRIQYLYYYNLLLLRGKGICVCMWVFVLRVYVS